VQPSPPPPAPPSAMPPPQAGMFAAAPVRRVSMAVMAAVTFLTIMIISLIFLYIFVYSGLPTDYDKYWWAGVTGWGFAFIFFWVHAATNEDPITWVLKWMFFILGAVFLYANVLASAAAGGPASWTFLWLIVLSIIVLVVLLFSWNMLRQKAADAERKAMRHRT